jgi:hypothetical protein
MIDRDQIMIRLKWAILAILAGILASIVFTGCTQTEGRSVRVREGVEQGKPTRWVEREQSESKTQAIDPQAIGEAVAAAVKSAVPGSDALAAIMRQTQEAIASMSRPKESAWTDNVGELLGAASAAGIGYLALAKRQQINQIKQSTKPPKE